MTTLVAVPDVLSLPVGASVRRQIDGALATEEKFKALMQSASSAVLPQIIWLVGASGRIGLIVARQRVFGLRYVDPETTPTREKTILASNKNMSGLATKLREQITNFLNNAGDLKQEFEDFEDNLNEDAGFSVELLLAPRNAVQDVEEKVIPIAKATKILKPTRSAYSPLPERESPVRSAPPQDTPAVAQDVVASQESVEIEDPQLALLTHLQGKLGQRLIAVWNPVDPTHEALGIVMDGETTEVEEFRAALLGQFMRGKF